MKGRKCPCLGRDAALSPAWRRQRSAASNSYAEASWATWGGWGLGAGVDHGEEEGSRARSGRVSVRRPVRADLAVRCRLTPQSPQLDCTRGAGPPLATCRGHPSGAPVRADPEAHGGSKIYCSREISKHPVQAHSFRCCQGNWTVPVPAGRRRANFPR